MHLAGVGRACLPLHTGVEICAAAKRAGDEITEREVTVLLADFATVWSELFPAEQARIVQLLVERVEVQEDALEVRIRAEGLASLVGELRQDERRAA
jgi:site-specific DNA recombinase